MKLTHFKCLFIVYLDEEGDFVLACLRTCEGNLWETILGCLIQDDVLLSVAVLVAESPYCYCDNMSFGPIV